MSEDLGDHGRVIDTCSDPVEGAMMIFSVLPQLAHL
jgi:hypothetical protein